jgi:very-short-patch-repair endonuclease
VLNGRIESGGHSHAKKVRDAALARCTSKEQFAQVMRWMPTHIEFRMHNVLLQCIKPYKKKRPIELICQAILCGFIVDFYLPEFKIVIEADGPHHETPEQRQKDQERDAILKGAGCTVIRYHHVTIDFRRDQVKRELATMIRKLRGAVV